MSVERWAFAKDGKIFMHEENDGWRYMKHGAETCEWLVSLGHLAAEYPDDFVRFVKNEMRAHHAAGHHSRGGEDAELYCRHRLHDIALLILGWERRQKWSPEAAKKLLEWLQAWPKQTVTTRNICQLGPRSLRCKETAVAAAETLVHMGVLEPVPRRRGSLGWRVKLAKLA